MASSSEIISYIFIYKHFRGQGCWCAGVLLLHDGLGVGGAESGGAGPAQAVPRLPRAAAPAVRQVACYLPAQVLLSAQYRRCLPRLVHGNGLSLASYEHNVSSAHNGTHSSHAVRWYLVTRRAVSNTSRCAGSRPVARMPASTLSPSMASSQNPICPEIRPSCP